MRKINPLLATDFYKTGHIKQYPENTKLIYSNFTPRSNTHAPKSEVFDGKIVLFGLQGFIFDFLIQCFNEGFFNRPHDEVVKEYKRHMDNALGANAVDVKHISDLHKLGYLPLCIKSLPEGSVVNCKIPVLTVFNTHPDFYWLSNYIETVMSNELWKPITIASIARQYRMLLEKYADATGTAKEFVLWQGHDFSARGMSGIADVSSSCAGHLLSFLGTDSISAIDYLEQNYFGYNSFIGGSVPASEHSVMCAGGKESEKDTYKRFITELYPTGIVSIVSDTWDFFGVVGKGGIAEQLKEDIIARKPDALGNAKVVFRPDSGDPVKIICGDPESTDENVRKGAVECLWDTFGGTITDKGYKMLDSHVGLIYGDSITLERAEAILRGLQEKGFASGNTVFGIGSFTYQHITRDTYGMAMKATYAIVNDEQRELYKDPITDNGVKKSAKGLLRVEKENGEYVLYDQQTPEQEALGELKVVFSDGKSFNHVSLDEIRKRVEESL